MELKPVDAFSALREGREIEFCFHHKWYYLGKQKKCGKASYVLLEVPTSQPSNCYVFYDLCELKKAVIHNRSLEEALLELDDYVIY